MLFVSTKEYLRRESNPYLRFRKPTFYPLDYRGNATYALAKVAITAEMNAQKTKSTRNRYSVPSALKYI